MKLPDSRRTPAGPTARASIHLRSHLRSYRIGSTRVEPTRVGSTWQFSGWSRNSTRGLETSPARPVKWPGSRRSRWRSLRPPPAQLRRGSCAGLRRAYAGVIPSNVGLPLPVGAAPGLRRDNFPFRRRPCAIMPGQFIRRIFPAALAQSGRRRRGRATGSKRRRPCAGIGPAPPGQRGGLVYGTGFYR